MDFTLKTYGQLLEALLNAGYTFQKFSDYLKTPAEKVVILRHDVDKEPFNALIFADIQSSYRITGSYYFRAVPESWDTYSIEGIAAMKNEVGYHYETMDTAKGDPKEAISQFEYHLKELRKFGTVETICIHGSPRSRHDNRALWDHYNYKDYGIIGEPYFDVDYSKVFYLTDTGRRWDGYKVSVRDKIPGHQERWEREGLVFRHTKDVIRAINEGRMPDKVMMTFHPQRWHDWPEFKFPWIKELLLQNAKNVVKWVLVKFSR